MYPLVLCLLACAGDPKPSAPPNVIVIALDNLRWDRTSLSGYERDTTPALSAFASQPGAVVFERAYASVSFSLGSYASIFTGLHASHHGVGFSLSTLPEVASTLAEALRDHGYRTGAFVGGASVRRESGLSQGFEVWLHPMDLSPLLLQLEPAMRWLDALPKDAPTFLFLHGYDAHLPYSVPPLFSERYDPGYRGPMHDGPAIAERDGLPKVAHGAYWIDTFQPELGGPAPDLYRDHDPSEPHIDLTEADLEHARAHYDGAIRAGDYGLSMALRELEERGFLEDSLVVVLSDHGEELGERGYFRHNRATGDEAFHVPLVIRLPGDAPAARRDSVFSMVDLTPTLLDALGLAPMGGIDGRSRLDLLRGEQNSDADEAISLSATQGNYWARSADWEVRWRCEPKHDPEWQVLRDGTALPEALAAVALVRVRSLTAEWPDCPQVSALTVRDSTFRDALQDAGYWVAPPTGETP